MPDFHWIRQGSHTTLSFQAFKPTGSVPNLTNVSASSPRLVVARNVGGSALFSATSGGTHSLQRCTAATNASAASGRFEAVFTSAATVSVTQGVYPAELTYSVAGDVRAYPVGFVVVQGQIR